MSIDQLLRDAAPGNDAIQRHVQEMRPEVLARFTDAATPEPRLLMLGAEAIAGHPLEKVAGTAERSVAE